MSKSFYFFCAFLLNSYLIHAQTCLPGGITFNTQAQIDAFPSNYPGCTQVLGSVRIDENAPGNITNLNGLSTLMSIEGSLVINDNDALTNLNGLGALKQIGSYVHIEYNDALANLSGLNALQSIGGYLQINFNNGLTSLNGLNALTSISGDLRIEINPILADITALNNLQSINGYLQINANDALTNLAGLDNINPATMTEVRIVNTAGLFICGVKSICDFLANPVNPASIWGNGIGCASRSEIEMACAALPTCCQNQPAFLTAAQQGFNALEQQCGITLSPKTLNDCQQTTYTWGDGSSTGPIAGNASANHLYTAPGFYDVCAKVQEINDMGVPCFTYDTCWQVCVTCDTCKMPVLKEVWSKLPATTNYGGGNNSYAQIYKDQTGDYYMIGTYFGTFDNGADPDFANQGDLDCVVAKYHNDGTLVPGFAFNIGGSLFDVGAAIAPHPTSGFFVGGIFHSPTLTLTAPGSGPDALLNRKSTDTHADVFLARYDNAMNIVWALNFGGLNNTQINDMAVDTDGNVVITGQALAKTNYDPLGTATTSTVDNYAAYTAKYNGNDGKLIWVRSVIGALNLGLDLDNAGNTYVGGHFQGPAFLDGSPVPGGGFPALGINSVISSSSDVAPFIIKFDPNGDFQWVLPIQNASGPKTATGAIWDVSVKDDKLFATGNTVTNVALDFGGSSIIMPATSGQFVARYNLNGIIEDHAVLPQNSKAFKLETVNGGKVYVGGTYGGGVMMTEIYDHNLNPVKTLYTAPGSNQDAVWAMAPDISGDFVIAGITGGSSLDLDPGANDGLEYPTLTAPTFVWAKYTCDCPGDAPTICSPCDSISTHFINKTNGKECCGGVRVNNLLANTFSGIQINVVSGGTLPILNVTPRTGWQITGFIDGQSVNLEPTVGGPIPTGFSNTAFVCFENLTAAEQVVEIKYFNLKDSVVCRDTLHFRCDYCVKFTRDSVACKGFDERELTFCVSVPPTQNWHVNSLVLMSPIEGITFSPSAFPMPNIAPGATSCTYTTTINIAAGTALPDTLCIKFTAHQMDITQGKPPGECCMTESCVVLPDCLCDSTWATAQSVGFKGDTCCWKFSLTNPSGVFNSINTQIVTPGVVFSTLAGAPGWMLDFNSVTDVNWLPQPPQGSFIQNGYVLPTVCFGEASLGSFVSPFEVEFTWTTPDGIVCDTTLELECPWLETSSSDCVILDSMRFKCPPASGLPFQLTVEIINNTFAPAFHAEKVTFVPLSPAGLNISPTMTNVSIPNGSSTNVTIDITGPIPTGSLFCFIAILHDLDAQGNELNCCSSDTFCYRMPFCPFFNMGEPIALFPNPTRDRFGLYFSENAPADSRIRLLDVSGRVVLEQPIEVGALSQMMSLDACPSGLYFVEIWENHKRIWLDKVVRQ